MDDGRGPPKRIRGNHQSPNRLASSSNSPPNAPLPSQIRLLNQVGQFANSWSRSDLSIMVNNDNNHIQASNTNESSLESENASFQRHNRYTIGATVPLQPGFHILQSHGVMTENTLRHQSVHTFGSAQTNEEVALNEEEQNLPDDVALNDELENLLDGGILSDDVQNLLDGIYLDDEMENLIDPHREMRLDIENMSYEEIIELGERIGSVSNGLSHETITTQLETNVYTPIPNSINLEELPSNEHEIDFCTVCQNGFKDQERIGILQCKHEYHVDCIIQWLVIKNQCPICKLEALTPSKNDA